jgi:hypothetical protein
VHTVQHTIERMPSFIFFMIVMIRYKKRSGRVRRFKAPLCT